MIINPACGPAYGGLYASRSIRWLFGYRGEIVRTCFRRPSRAVSSSTSPTIKSVVLAVNCNGNDTTVNSAHMKSATINIGWPPAWFDKARLMVGVVFVRQFPHRIVLVQLFSVGIGMFYRIKLAKMMPTSLVPVDGFFVGIILATDLPTATPIRNSIWNVYPELAFLYRDCVHD